MFSGVSTSLANLHMEIYGVGNKKSKCKKNINPNTPTSNRRISLQAAASTKICQMSKWGQANLNLSLYRGEKWAVKFPLINAGKWGS